jgi:hypothetical protein
MFPNILFSQKTLDYVKNINDMILSENFNISNIKQYFCKLNPERLGESKSI